MLEDSLGVWQRPHFQFRSLPLDIRWEVTRRHPIYQAFWRTFELNSQASEEDRKYALSLLESLAQFLLSAINVGAVRPSPTLEFEQLDQEYLKTGWMSGAVHPLSNRQLLALLMAALPKETLAEVGLCMMHAGLEKDIGVEPRRLLEIKKLKNLDCAGLDSFIDEPFVSINPAASMRDITDALSSLLADWKSERGLSEQRVPSREKLKAYLEIWDLREGWDVGHYDRSRELTFQEIASQKNTSINTIHNQYRSAFRLITGHEYSVDNWCEVFGSLKLDKIFGNLGRAGRLRPLIQKTRRDIPESVISSGELPDFVSTNACVEEVPAAGLPHQIKELVSAGKSDEEIACELDLQHPDALPLLRSRLDDLPT